MTHYVRPMIHGTAPGGAKKFVGSKHADITMPMKKSCLARGVALRLKSREFEFQNSKMGHTDTNSFKKTRPTGSAGLEYSAKIPAGPRLEKFTTSYLPAAMSAASASCGNG